MNAVPLFSLTRNGNSLITVALNSSTVQQGTTVEVNELQHYGFEIEPREQDTEYDLWLGDVEAGQSLRSDNTFVSTVGVARGRLVFWDDANYFDGARGKVMVRVRSRSPGAKSSWRERGGVEVVVKSSKLSDDRYAGMFRQMSGLAAGLVLDLVSKMKRTSKLSILSSKTHIRTSAVELRILEETWPKIAMNLQRIIQSPHVTLQRTTEVRNCWGSELLGSRSVATLASNGIDPKNRSVNLPFKAHVEQIQESLDTSEHRMIRGFIDLLDQRARDCRSNLVRHITSIRRERKWRDLPSTSGLSLYDREDLPRIERLEDGLRRVDQLINQLQIVRQTSLLSRVRPSLNFRSTPIFAYVEPYRRIRHEMLRFLQAGLVIVDEGSDMRIKSTSRLYEQWIFLQLAAAFRKSGLTCVAQQGVLHTSRMFRFTLDLDRGARVTFTSNDGRAVVLKYEPWVLPRAVAMQNRDSIYRGTQGDSAWCPDVIIEFHQGQEEVGSPPVIEYAVVIDAKYSRAIRDHHWNDTSKYLQIRASANGRQIVRQQWLAFPSDSSQSDEVISLRDSSIQWTNRGPNCGREENVQGTLALCPPVDYGSAAVADGWIVSPEDSAREFVHGLLKYLNFEVISEPMKAIQESK